ncbi:MAG: integration host factor subunit beta [Alphaproteobacteria bacterium]|nr:integration host factor subunit beta [Alphaproteobacteria bacterium]
MCDRRDPGSHAGEPAKLKEKGLTVNRSDLVKRLAASFGLTIEEADAALAAVLDGIGAELAAGGRVELRGFGAFTVREYAARRGRNPKSGAAVEVPARKVVHFKPGRQIFNALNDDPDALSALRAQKEKQRRWLDERSGQLSLF